MASSEPELRAEITEACRRLHAKGYLAANDGNVAVRLPDGHVLVTPSGAHKGFLHPSDLVVVDADGRQLSGEPRRPTGELPMHLYALRARPDIAAVVHAHPPTCIAMSLVNKPLDGYLPEVILSIGGFEVVPYARPISTALGESLRGYIERRDALVLERHGTITVAKTVMEAYALTERLEHAAEVLWRAHLCGTPVPLPPDERRALEDMHARARAQGH